MAHDVYYEFHQNLEQLRRHGARGGKATVRNRHERLQGAAAEAPEREREAAHNRAPPRGAHLRPDITWRRSFSTRFPQSVENHTTNYRCGKTTRSVSGDFSWYCVNVSIAAYGQTGNIRKRIISIFFSVAYDGLR